MKRITQITETERRRIIDRERESKKGIEETVREILEDVRCRGDEAVTEYTRKFDTSEFRLENLKVTESEVREARETVDSGVEDAIERAAGNIAEFHEKQIPRDYEIGADAEITLGRRYVALDSCGLYIPGGGAAYPSTALMTGVPATVADVDRVVAVTPPPVEDVTLVALSEVGVDEIYRMGGSQAVAALSYGTQKVREVDAVVGPGNRYVTEAKEQVRRSSRTKIEFPAGPSEIGVVASHDADAEYVAADVLAQLEHDPDAEAVVTTPSRGFAKKVENEIESQLESMNRKEVAEKADRYVLVGDTQECIELMREYAPEHLSITLGDAETEERMMSEIPSAGSVFLGSYTPVALGDYASGTNHVLPTMGYARLHGGLSVEDFLKSYSYQRATKTGLNEMSDTVTALAETEGLSKHSDSVSRRTDK